MDQMFKNKGHVKIVFVYNIKKIGMISVYFYALRNEIVKHIT